MKRKTVALTILVLAFGVVPGGLMAQAPASPPSMPMMGGEGKGMMDGKMMDRGFRASAGRTPRVPWHERRVLTWTTPCAR